MLCVYVFVFFGGGKAVLNVWVCIGVCVGGGNGTTPPPRRPSINPNAPPFCSILSFPPCERVYRPTAYLEERVEVRGLVHRVARLVPSHLERLLLVLLLIFFGLVGLVGLVG